MINFLNWLDGVLWGVPLIVLMAATGAYFTIRSGFFQFRYFGRIGAYLLAVVMVIFTVTTSGGWFTYYLAILEHIGRDDTRWKQILMKVFYAMRALPGLLWTIYLVKTNNQGFIWTVVDITSAIPTFVNVAVILILSGDYFRLLKDYKARYMGIGTVDGSVRLFYEEKTEGSAL